LQKDRPHPVRCPDAQTKKFKQKKFAPNYQTKSRQITKQICAKLPNEFAPNYQTNPRQIAEFTS